MSNELQTLNEKIAERIGKDLVDLIPKDQWQSMVDNEISKFRRDTAPGLIRDLIKDDFLARARIELDKLTSASEWNDEAKAYINEELIKYISSSSGSIFAGMLAPSTQMVLENLRHNLGY
jgi:hypothetical protein